MTFQRLQQLTVLWIVVLVLGSLSPGDVKEAAGTETRSHVEEVRRNTFQFHRVMHYIGFGVAAALATAVSRNRAQRILYPAGLIVLGCALEIIQHRWLGSRHLETWDMRDDAIAVCLGASLTLAFWNRLPIKRPAR